jgi:hypothetical protein
MGNSLYDQARNTIQPKTNTIHHHMHGLFDAPIILNTVLMETFLI